MTEMPAEYYKQKSAEAINKTRPKSFKRLMIIDTVIKYVKKNNKDEWKQYKEEYPNGKKFGWISSMTLTEFKTLIEKYSTKIFGADVTTVIVDASDRSMRDAKHTTEFFYRP